MKNCVYDIIIQAGQSNTEGCGIGPVAQDFVPDERIEYLAPIVYVTKTDEGMDIQYSSQPLEIKQAQERIVDGELRGDFSLSFAEKYICDGLLEDGRKLLIIRGAVGGTGFQKKHWGMNDLVYMKMIQMVDLP